MIWEFVNLRASAIPVADKQLYYDMWTMLAGMPSLQRIRVAVAAHECPDQVPADLQEVWLGPLKQLGRMDIFEVLVRRMRSISVVIRDRASRWERSRILHRP